MDLFEHYDMIPKDVSHIIDNWEDYETYEGLERLLIILREKGYTFDYDLSCSPFNLRKIDEDIQDNA